MESFKVKTHSTDAPLHCLVYHSRKDTWIPLVPRVVTKELALNSNMFQKCKCKTTVSIPDGNRQIWVECLKPRHEVEITKCQGYKHKSQKHSFPWWEFCTQEVYEFGNVLSWPRTHHIPRSSLPTHHDSFMAHND